MREVIKQTSNYRRATLLSSTYKRLSNILLSRLTPYVDEITGGNKYVLRPDKSGTDHIFSILQNVKTMWENNGAIIKLFINFEKD